MKLNFTVKKVRTEKYFMSLLQSLIILLIVKIYKRVQILVADIWACFEGKSYGEFNDIDSITMFADYRYDHLSIEIV